MSIAPARRPFSRAIGCLHGRQVHSASISKHSKWNSPLISLLIGVRHSIAENFLMSSKNQVKSAAVGFEQAQPIHPNDFPETHPYGRSPPTTIGNLRFMLDHYGIKIRYNAINKRLDHEFPGLVCNPDNVDNVSLAQVTSLAARNGLQTQNLPMFVDAIADSDTFNPVRDWIESVPWDDQDRLRPFYETVTVIDDFPIKIRDTLLHRWLLSATAAAVLPDGFHARGVLTLQGEQSVGKTSWIRRLLPEPLRASFLKSDHHLDPSNKDSVIAAVSHWMVEIGELDSSFRKDIARLKGFLTSDRDKVRRPYARSDSHYPRRTVFCATVNEANFLVDNTGNSRWWTLPVKALDSNHSIDMQQLFAQLKLAVDAGEQWWLTPDEEAALNAQNLAHLSVSVIRERMLQHLEEVQSAPSASRIVVHLTASKVLEALGFDEVSNKQAKECAAILRERIGESKRVNGSNKWAFPTIAERKTTPSSAPRAAALLLPPAPPATGAAF